MPLLSQKKVILTSFTQTAVNLGEVELSFIVDPFLYDYEETTVTSTNKSFNVYNTGSYEADTLIKIYGSGNIQISCNGETMQIDNVSNYVLLDSKNQECVGPTGQSKDWDTIGNYIKLDVGDNTIELTGTVTKTEITYRNTYL